MISIRRKLLGSILLVIFIVTVLLAAITYFSVREEMDEFYDENLKLVAHTILATGPTETSQSAANREIDYKLKGEEEYLTQVWKNGKLEYSSHPFVQFPLQENEGKGRADFEGSIWRFYKKTEGEISVQMAQDLKERHSVVVEIYSFLLIPIIIQFPILGGLIWLFVGYGLRPLSDISLLIKNRNSSFLEPLPSDKVPVEVSVLVSELNNLLARLKGALEIQKKFTADAAHELRTPLTAVRLQLDILKRAESEKEENSALTELERGVLRSTHLVQQMLELARQEPENAETIFSDVDLKAVIEECVVHALPLAKFKNIEIKSVLNSVIISGNVAKLAVMVGNLLSNAIAYTGIGGHIELSLQRNTGKIILNVADDGIGLPEKDRDRVFDRFYRVAGTGTTGSGLGLSIVRSVCDLHNADIVILEGIAGRGTTFQIIFNE